MVKDNLDKPVVHSKEQSQAAESQNQQPDEPTGPEWKKSPERDKPDSQEPAERWHDLLHQNEFNLEEEFDTWRQVEYLYFKQVTHSMWSS